MCVVKTQLSKREQAYDGVCCDEGVLIMGRNLCVLFED